MVQHAVLLDMVSAWKYPVLREYNGNFVIFGLLMSETSEQTGRIQPFAAGNSR